LSRKYHIIYLGCSGFPYGMAEVQKMTLISKSLVHAGHQVNIISNWTMFKEKDHPGFKTEGLVDGIHYKYTTKSPYRVEGKFAGKLQRLQGLIREFFYLWKLRKRGELDFAILSTHSIKILSYYVLVSKLFRFKTILNYVEFYSGIKKKSSKWSLTINDFLFDKYAPRLVDGNFPISEFLINHLHEVAPSGKYLKIPILTDYGKYNGIENHQKHTYFLFCGAAIYIKVVEFIINAYSALDDPKIPLHLVINGNEEKISRIKSFISRSKYPERIMLFSKLSEKELFNQYKSAAALLIPLKPDIQDSARFPHKIGEYLASGNPVISTNFGEVKFYFSHHQNMLIADHFDIQEYAGQMQFVLDHPEKARQIGKAGYDFGKAHFDYLLYGELISSFLNQLI